MTDQDAELEAPPEAVRGDPPRVTYAGWGALVALGGLIAVLMAFTMLAWFNRASAKFPEINTRLSGDSKFYNGWAQTYFGWLAWVLAAVTFAAALLANTVPRATVWFRAAGVASALVSVALTFRALNLFIGGVPTYSDFLGQARSGFYTALAGFVAMGVGAALGGRRRAAPKLSGTVPNDYGQAS